MIRSLVSAGVAGLASYAATRAVMSSRLRRQEKVLRTNHSGREVSLVEGPALAAGLLAGSVLIEDPRQRGATLLATAVAGGLGGVDDFLESGSSKGLRGHLGALARGEITTGALKVIGIPVASVAAAAILGSGQDPRDARFPALTAAVDTVVAGGVIAGTANLFNLLDLRPGRALKAGFLTLALMEHDHGTSWVPAAGIAGSSAGAWTEDLAGETMLGDTGANALGAALGTMLAAGSGPRHRAAILAVLVALTLLSEKVSFTSVIEATPGLRELDAFGREHV
ncbi:hypothetical protein DFO66_11814 [Brevibacterium sanguinis]|uniref:Glycosyl transferase family 4 n=2 Tax=Brevibacterium TaxID=1696 RepID=A0A366ICQ2_9MICO|nr:MULTISPECIES: hypothetical protein [Brevibacterium]RBP61881.1 hypothetical protein DFO66_11814 [Brevibacterium sanguinis]RBP68673.1 hypothetical protein DFO65_11643 [Brevibacterium celere]